MINEEVYLQIKKTIDYYFNNPENLNENNLKNFKEMIKIIINYEKAIYKLNKNCLLYIDDFKIN